MALYNMDRGFSLLDYLNDIYSRFGYFEEILVSRTFKGQAGIEKIKGLMSGLRENTPGTIGGIAVSVVRDYQKRVETDCTSGRGKAIKLPESNVLQFVLTDGTIITARPSGTEPKIKFYASCRADRGTELSEAKKEVGNKLEKIKEAVEELCD
jgi:phosphoglucomutase